MNDEFAARPSRYVHAVNPRGALHQSLAARSDSTERCEHCLGNIRSQIERTYLCGAHEAKSAHSLVSFIASARFSLLVRFAFILDVSAAVKVVLQIRSIVKADDGDAHRRAV